MKLSKKARQAEQIIKHGNRLISIFNLPANTNPHILCKKLHRLESMAHRLSEEYCNGERGMDDKDAEKMEWEYERILNSVDTLLGFSKLDIPVFINRDPRGYALKIESEYVYKHSIEIERDWGGYGLIAPEFTGE